MFSNIARWSDRAIEAFAVIVLLAMLTAVMLGVITRALDDPLIWTDELSRYLLVWTAGLGWVIASRRRVHIRITFFIDLLPQALHRAAEFVIQIGVLVFGALMIWQGLELVERNADLEATAMPVSVAWLYAPLILIGFYVAAQAIAEAGQALTGSRPIVAELSEVIE